MPSFRLLTSPAWLTLERSRSRSVVRPEDLALGEARPLGRCEGLSPAFVMCVTPWSRARSRPTATSPTSDEDHAEIERLGAQTVARRDVARSRARCRRPRK